jgi:3-hydroxybutyrate dehydrogenase
VLIADLQLRPEAIETIEKYGPTHAAFQKTDVTSWVDLTRAWNRAKELFSQVDIVCPGAGVFEPSWSSFWKPPGTDSSVVDTVHGGRYKQLDINLVHPIRLTQFALTDHLLRVKNDPMVRTTVLHLSSIAGQVTPLWCPLYAVSKHGVNALVRTMGPLEQRLGFRVVAVAPGLVRTPMWTEHPDKHGPISADTHWVTPEQVAQVMLDLVEKTETEAHIAGHQPSGIPCTLQIKGGTILEVSGLRVREVQQLNDPGPQGIEDKDFDASAMEEEVFQNLMADSKGYPSKL